MKESHENMKSIRYKSKSIEKSTRFVPIAGEPSHVGDFVWSLYCRTTPGQEGVVEEWVDWTSLEVSRHFDQDIPPFLSVIEAVH